jgi:hypothetical protein
VPLSEQLGRPAATLGESRQPGGEIQPEACLVGRGDAAIGEQVIPPGRGPGSRDGVRAGLERDDAEGADDLGAAMEDVPGAAAAGAIVDPPLLEGVVSGPARDGGDADEDEIAAAKLQAAPGLPSGGDGLGEEIIAISPPAAEEEAGGAAGSARRMPPVDPSRTFGQLDI